MTERPAKARGAIEVILFEETRFRGSLMFTSSEVTIGSDPAVMVRLLDPEVAPCHAVLRFDGESSWIEDCGSALGTAVNGEPVSLQPIEATDEISIGRHRLRVTLHRADTTPAPLSVRPIAKPAAPARPPLPPARPSLAAPPRPTPASQAPPEAPRGTGPIWPPVAAAPPSAKPSPEVSPARPKPAASPPVSVVPAPARPSAVAAATVARATPPPPAAPIAAVPAPKRPSAVAAATVARATPPAAAAPVPLAPAPRPAAAVRPTGTMVLSGLPSPGPADAQSAPAMATAVAPAPRSEVQAIPVNRLFSVPAEDPQPDSPPRVRAFPDDDDDDDVAFEPSFSLLDGLSQVGLASAATDHAVEVIRFRHGCVTKLRHLRSGERLRLPGLRKAVGRSARPGRFSFFRDVLPNNATIRQAGQPIDHAEWRNRADKRGQVALDPGTQVVFPLPGGEGVLVQLVPAATPLPKQLLRLKLSRLMLWIGGLSLLIHLVVFAVIGLTSLVRHEYLADNKEGRFARIALKEIELEPPAAPPAREKKKAKPEPSETAPITNASRVAVAHIPRMRSAPVTPASATAQKLLSALGSISAAPKSSMATAISNLDAVGPVHGGGFKVSGAIGKLPGDSLRLASAGSGIGRLDTKSANDVGKNLGRVFGRAPTGQVRAQVTAKPNAMKVEGHLDRGEIQRVINSHIHELQGCYERQLISSPNLSGKVTFEWVIGTSGGVTSVKIKTSTLSSNEATSCMQAAVRRWQFPSPSGGSVTVIYPIALASSGT